MAYSARRKQMLNWARTTSPEKWLEFHYTRWMKLLNAEDMISGIKKASEAQLDDLYILREELRLKI